MNIIVSVAWIAGFVSLFYGRDDLIILFWSVPAAFAGGEALANITKGKA